MVASDTGVIIYGGMSWDDIDMSVTDQVQTKKNAFGDKCNKIIQDLVLRTQEYYKDLPLLGIDDIGSYWWD